MTDPHHGPVPASAAVPSEAQAPVSSPDDDLALGCECANPALQIERWAEVASMAQPAGQFC